MADAARPTPQAILVPARRTWSLPILRELPKLTDLTLASAIGGGGGTGGGGSTVFGILLALFALAGCASDRTMEPVETARPQALTAVTCRATVATKEVTCDGGPSGAPGPEILGGQGVFVRLRSSNARYDGTYFLAEVTVQNLLGQVIGDNNGTQTGVYVFFESGPTLVSGSGSVTVENEDGNDVFLAGNVPYFFYDETLFQHQVSAPHTWAFAVDPTVDQFSFTVMVAADVPDQGGILRWTNVRKLTNGGYTGAAAQSADDMMAVAVGGRTSRWDGSRWIELTPVGSESFSAVVTAGPTEYIAVGYNGYIYRSKGNSWDEVFYSGMGAYYGVWAESADSVTAVAPFHLTTCTADGCNTEFPPDMGGFGIRWIGGDADGSYRAAMTIDGVYTESHDHGTTWSAGINAVDDRTDVFIAGMTVDPDGDIIALIDIPGLATRVVRLPDDTLFRADVAAGLGITAIGDDSVAVTYFDYNVTGARLLTIGYADLIAIDVNVVSGGQTTEAGARGIAPVDETNTEFLLFNPDVQTLTRWTGATFRNEDPAPSGADVDVATIGDTLYLVNGTAQLWRVLAGSGTAIPTGLGPITEIATYGAGVTAQMLIVEDESDIYRRNGGSWDPEAEMPNGNTIRDIWGEAIDDRWFVVGTGGTLFAHTTGGGWIEELTGNGDDLTEVWGCGSTVWIGSTDGKIYTAGVGPLAEDVGFNLVYMGGGIAAIGGSSCSDVWVTTDAAMVYHWDGAAWSFVGGVGGGTLRSILVRSPGEAYIGGDNATLALATTVAPPVSLLFTGGRDRSLQSMAMTADGTIYAAGPGFLSRASR